ncbi:sulfatase domain protein [Mycobacterium xenopi 3993]|nr:sulfatase domain protein [Mycobacterium xenopi 3993]
MEEMTTLLKSPNTRGVFGPSELPTDIPTSAPSHILAVRTHDAKLATYSYWKPGGMDVDTSRPIEREFYDYSTRLGAQEVDNQADRNPKEAGLQELLDHKVLAEVRAPLPAFLDDAQQQGLADMRRLVARRGG